MTEGEQNVAITVRVSAATHRALQRLAQRERRSPAGLVRRAPCCPAMQTRARVR
jgi:hypothetical protein